MTAIGYKKIPKKPLHLGLDKKCSKQYVDRKYYLMKR
jgi:hypothetical protein